MASRAERAARPVRPAGGTVRPPAGQVAARARPGVAPAERGPALRERSAAPVPAGSDPAPASRAASGLPTGPTLGGAIRLALGNAWYHSWRLLPANVAWSAAAVAIGIVILITPLGLLLLPLLALPTAGIFRIAARIARGEAVSFWDAADAWRTELRATLGLGAAIGAAVLVLSANVVIGLTGASPIGWALATLAAWGLLALWLLAWTAWPILADPLRADQPALARLRLAALLVLAHPVRIASLGVALALFLALSTVAIVALVTISVALAGLVSAEFVLPAADRLEARLAADRRALAGPIVAPASAEIADTP